MIVKISPAFIIFLVLVFYGCNRPDAVSQNESYIHRLVNPLKINKRKNILIYTINPNDCISCLNGFKSFNSSFSTVENAQLYIVSVEREVEKNELLKKTSLFNFSPDANKIAFWNKDIFDKTNNALNINLSMSSLCVYNYTLDSVIFCKPIREIADQAEVKKLLE